VDAENGILTYYLPDDENSSGTPRGIIHLAGALINPSGNYLAILSRRMQ
jgi:hypothetical protein